MAKGIGCQNNIENIMNAKSEAFKKFLPTGKI
jgi:hypothetical protein